MCRRMMFYTTAIFWLHLCYKEAAPTEIKTHLLSLNLYILLRQKGIMKIFISRLWLQLHLQQVQNALLVILGL